MIRRPPRSTQGVSSAASDVYKRQVHMGLTDNASFADCEEAAVAEHCRVAAAESGVDAVVILCTNMRGAQSARALQEVDGITVYDSIAVTVAETLRLVDLAPAEMVPPAFLARL